MEILYKCMSTVDVKRGFAVVFRCRVKVFTFSSFWGVERGYLYEGSRHVFGWQQVLLCLQ